MVQALFKIITTSMILFISVAHVYAKENYIKSYDFTSGERYAAVVANCDTGEILYQKNGGRLLYPASLTKMMTIYLTFQALDSKKLSLYQKLPISVKAASQPRLNLRLKAGKTITVRDAILALIIHSANDAAVALAEALGENETIFAARMTDTAKLLGMKDTEFRNAHGLPHPEQVTTAYDMARLAIALRRDYPHYYPLFAVKSFKHNGKIINTHNHVMRLYPWADGLKTGFINSSGFNLVTSARKDNDKLVGVVMGGHTRHARDYHMIQLLEYGYNRLQAVKLADESETYEASSFKPSKKGAFEIAQASNQKFAEDEEISSDNDEDDVALGNLVDKGLSENISPPKLEVKNIKAKKPFNPKKAKITIIKGNKKVTRALHKTKNKKIIVVRSKASKNSKTIQPKKRVRQLNSQIG